ncbi:MAG: exonuclease SbcCD subunit D C-terminal domain-containing protein [Lentimicrobium sp.]|nr:exonuclease SbcCD subunit D C-terminal domain-containing protein [Lentimicrobium sp.]
MNTKTFCGKTYPYSYAGKHQHDYICIQCLPSKFMLHTMKILHTSDWHLGRSLYVNKRYDEFDKFLKWLLELIAHEKIDVLLVAGDIFDTTTPGNRAQELYYNFLGQLSQKGCRHAVIIGGNHDSPSLLDAPKSLLNALSIHVVGCKSERMEDEVIVLKSKEGKNEAIVCAVPFLRDRDVRSAEAGESPEDKAANLVKGIAGHYSEIAALAAQRQDVDHPVPVVGMGHLFTSKGRTSEGDGVRELYIGTIAHVDGESISEGFDYVALGHLHLAQLVGGNERVRYAGAPIPMGFAEAGQTKKVIVIEFEDKNPIFTEHEIPVFQELVGIYGDLEAITSKIEALKADNSSAWLEIEINTQFTATDISAHFEELLRGSALEILRIKNRTLINKTLTPLNETENLEALDDADVFVRCLNAYEIAEEDRPSLTETYREAISLLQNADPNDK